MLFADTPELVQAIVAVGAIVGPMFTAWLAYLVVKLGKKQESVGRDVERIEKATNSMKDALVRTTDKEAFARGVKSETDKR